MRRIVIPTAIAMIEYIGEEENYPLELFATKPKELLNQGDIILIPKESLRWVKLKRLPFKEISPDDTASLFAPSKEVEEGDTLQEEENQEKTAKESKKSKKQ